MNITYSQLEDFLMEVHGVAPEKRVALKGRLKHFQRLGWPIGTNKGKGARVNYDIGQTINLAMGFEMLQLGLTPERVVDHFSLTGTTLAYGIAEVLKNYGKKNESVYYIFYPESLSTLRDATMDGQKTGLQSQLVSASKLQDALSMASLHWTRRFAMIDIAGLLKTYVEYFLKHGLQSPDQLIEAVQNWQNVERDLSAAKLNLTIRSMKSRYGHT